MKVHEGRETRSVDSNINSLLLARRMPGRGTITGAAATGAARGCLNSTVEVVETRTINRLKVTVADRIVRPTLAPISNPLDGPRATSFLDTAHEDTLCGLTPSARKL